MFLLMLFLASSWRFLSEFFWLFIFLINFEVAGVINLQKCKYLLLCNNELLSFHSKMNICMFLSRSRITLCRWVHVHLFNSIFLVSWLAIFKLNEFYFKWHKFNQIHVICVTVDIEWYVLKTCTWHNKSNTKSPVVPSILKQSIKVMWYIFQQSYVSQNCHINRKIFILNREQKTYIFIL